ncbi:MAG: GntR family transcriptional regulator [Lachnospiraceae bacterium]|nr:GntR family transcriptional regulator [Lachnospiraceae bacterium]
MTDDFNLIMEDFLPLRDVVFNTLRRAILTGQLKPGERLMEVHLANKLGVSRTPIREAIRKLELEGLVVMVPRKGAEVAKISEKSLKDVLEVRRALDELIAELACSRISSEQLKELKEAAEAFERATKTEDTASIARADVAFHDIIMESTGNSRLKQLVNNLAEQMYRYRFVYLKDETKHGMLVKEHSMIYDAIKKKDKEAAAKAAREHIDNQEKAIIAHIRMEKEYGND